MVAITTEQRQHMRDELAQALATLRQEMTTAIGNGDRDLYVTLTNRYGRAHARWEQLAQEQTR